MTKLGSHKRIIVLCLLILVLGLIVVSVNIVFQPLGTEVRQYPGSGITLADFPDMGTLRVRPDTILQSLAQGNASVFQPSAPPPIELEPKIAYHVVWRQQDFLQIADAAFKYQWKESPSTWKLYALSFDTGCQYAQKGFWRGHIIYYKPFWQGFTLRYTTREIDIYPFLGFVQWGANSSYPHPILGWPAIDMKTLRMSADHALNATEQQGGKSARLAVENKCHIHMDIYSNRTERWWIYYAENSGAMMIQSCIDATTGAFRTIPNESVLSCK